MNASRARPPVDPVQHGLPVAARGNGTAREVRVETHLALGPLLSFFVLACAFSWAD